MDQWFNGSMIHGNGSRVYGSRVGVANQPSEGVGRDKEVVLRGWGVGVRNHFTETCCGNEEGSYLRYIESCITQTKAQGPSRTCNESKEEEERIRVQDFGFRG